LKIIYNLIPYSKIKKNSNQKHQNQMRRKKQLKGLYWNFAGANAKFEEEKKEKKRNDCRCQTSSDYDTHESPLCRWFRDLPNTVLKDEVWWLDNSTHATWTRWGQSTCWKVPVSFFKIILNKLLLQCYFYVTFKSIIKLI
jgi:hypothetical protein